EGTPSTSSTAARSEATADTFIPSRPARRLATDLSASAIASLPLDRCSCSAAPSTLRNGATFMPHSAGTADAGATNWDEAFLMGPDACTTVGGHNLSDIAGPSSLNHPCTVVSQ